MSWQDDLNDAIGQRTGGRLLGEMTGEEIAAAFASGPIMIRDGKLLFEWDE